MALWYSKPLDGLRGPILVCPEGCGLLPDRPLSGPRTQFMKLQIVTLPECHNVSYNNSNDRFLTYFTEATNRLFTKQCLKLAILYIGACSRPARDSQC